MTTGEKLALLRKRKGMTQEELSAQLGVSRQSVSKWEMDVSFPETDKLIKLSKLYECSIDYLLSDGSKETAEVKAGLSVQDAYLFVRECGYFFLATSVDDQPRLRPFGMIYEKNNTLFIATDKRKQVYAELQKNPKVELASYNPGTRKWIRMSGRAEIEDSRPMREEMMNAYSNLRGAYQNKEEMYLAIYRLQMDNICIR